MLNYIQQPPTISILNPGVGVENYSKTDSKTEKNIAY